MSSSSASICIEELVARKTVKHGDEFSIITIPGLPALSESDRRTLCAKLVSELDTPYLDLGRVNTLLEDFSRDPFITPPPESDIPQDRELEEQSRKALLDAGCPPCYPSDLEFPLRNIPEKYEVVSYWKSLGGTGRVVLTAQLFNWRLFCKFQDQVRQYYLKRGTFPDFVEEVRDRRRRHGLEVDMCLLADPKQQSRLENWIEFQNYHLMLHERIEIEENDKREERDAARKELEKSGLEDAEELDFLKGKTNCSQHKVEEHAKMLEWIEQQRKAMVAEQAASVHAPKYRERSSIPTLRGGRKRNQKCRSPLGPVRSAVLKSPKQNALRSSKRNESQPAKNTTANPNIPHRRSRISKSKARSPRRGERSTLLSPFNPQKVVKTIKRGYRGNISTKKNAKPQNTGQSNSQKPGQDCAAIVVTTRNGRKIKTPEWFRPG